ncbi:hypothetical protein CEUSTIGMA_g13723.t1, partial [Chlamydomonas eustigma]
MYQSPNKRSRSDEPDLNWRPSSYPDQLDSILNYFKLSSIRSVASAALLCMQGLREVYISGNRFQSHHSTGVKALFHQAVAEYKMDAHLVRIPERNDAECVSPRFFNAAQTFHDEIMTTDYIQLTDEQLCQLLHTGTLTNQIKKPTLLDQWNRMIFHYTEDNVKFSLIQRSVEQTALISAMQAKMSVLQSSATSTAAASELASHLSSTVIQDRPQKLPKA